MALISIAYFRRKFVIIVFDMVYCVRVVVVNERDKCVCETIVHLYRVPSQWAENYRFSDLICQLVCEKLPVSRYVASKWLCEIDRCCLKTKAVSARIVLRILRRRLSHLRLSF